MEPSSNPQRVPLCTGNLKSGFENGGGQSSGSRGVRASATSRLLTSGGDRQVPFCSSLRGLACSKVILLK